MIKQLIQRRHDIIFPPITRVIWCFAEGNSLNGLEGLVDEFVQGLPDFENYSGDHVLIVLDDLMVESGKSQDVLNMFIRKNHHNNISCILSMQNLFHKNLRDLTLNCKYLVVLKNPRSTEGIACLGRQMNHGKRNHCLELAYEDACATPYSYVLLDLSQTCNDSMRIRSSLFPEQCIVYVKK